jgi:hypothetical protein
MNKTNVIGGVRKAERLRHGVLATEEAASLARVFGIFRRKP